MDAERIPVGYVRRAHGVRGDLLVVPLTDNPDRFVVGAVLSFEAGGRPATVTSLRPHNEGLIVTLAELTDRTDAEAVTGQRLMISPSQRRDLDEDEYWPEDLIGLAVVSDAGARLGTVTDVVLGAAQDRLVVATPDGSSVDVPFVSALVDEPADGRIVVRPPEGLFAREKGPEAEE